MELDTYTRNISVPMVEHSEILSQGGNDRHLNLRIIINHLSLKNLFVFLGSIQADLLRQKAIHVGLQRACPDGLVIGGK